MKQGFAVFVVGAVCFAGGGGAVFADEPRGEDPCREAYQTMTPRGAFDRVADGATRAIDFLDRAYEHALHYYQGPARASNPYDLKWHSYYPLEALRFLYNGPVRSVSILPEFADPTAKVFNKQWTRGYRSPWDPRQLLAKEEYKPTEEDIELLKKYNALERFEDRARFIREHPKWISFRRWFGRVTGALLVANNLYLINHFAQLQDGVIELDRYLKDPKERLADDEVGWIVDTVPFPHAALQIGKTVYSYGISNLSSQSVGEYFRSRELGQANDAGLGALKSEDGRGLADRARDGSIDLVSGMLSDLKRSAHLIPIKLKPEEIAALKRDLELSVGKQYKNITQVNDCSTMLVRALERNTSIRIGAWVDAYPTLTAEYLTSLRSQGDRRIGKPRLLKVDPKQNTQLMLLRDAHIALIEGRLGVMTFPYEYGYRLYLDETTDEADLQFMTPEVREGIEKWRGRVRKELLESEDTRLVLDKFKEPDPSGPRDTEKVGKLLDEIFRVQREKAVQEYQSSESDLNALMAAQYKLQALDELKAQILETVRVQNEATRSTRPAASAR